MIAEQFPPRLQEFGGRRRAAARPTRRAVTVAAFAWLSMTGCEPDPPTVPAQSIPEFAGDVARPPGDMEKSSVELPSATAELDAEAGIVKFDIQYRFTSGPPRAFYLVNIAFPGTDRYGVKPIDAPELEREGTITTRIEVGDDPVDAFEITMSEASSPDRGYYLISEPLRGHVKRAAEAPEESSVEDAEKAAESAAVDEEL